MKRIFLFALTPVLFAACHGGPPPPHSGVVVTGECLKEVAPDRASIVLTSEVLKPDAAEASNKVNADYAEFKKAIEELKLKDLHLDTQEFSVNEDWDYGGKVRKSLGFRARLGLRVRTSEVTRMAEVIGVAAKFGIRNVGSLETYISDERYKSEYEGCLGEALKNAQAKAENLAKTGNRNLGQLRLVSEEGAAAPSPRPMPIANFQAKAARAEDASGGTDGGGFAASARMIQVHIAAEFDFR